MIRASETLAGWGRLIGLGLKTGWPGMIGIVLLCSGLIFAVTASLDALYPTFAERQLYADTLGASSISETFNGRGYALTSIGGIAAFEIGFMGQLLSPILSLYVAIRNTRSEEAAGRMELVTAGRVGRLAPLAAGAALIVATCLGVGVTAWAGMTLGGAPAAGSMWYAASVALLMLLFGSVGLLLGQLAQSARTAYLAGLGVVTTAFLLRALVDGLRWSTPWLSPLGWHPEVRAFGDLQAWPLVACFVGSATLIALSAVIVRHRDLGAGAIAPRPGRQHAARTLSTPTGLAWRLNRAPALSWMFFSVLWAGIFGLISREMSALIDENPMMLEAVGVERGSDLVITMAVVVVALAATSMCIQGIGRLSAEETSDRLGALMATRISRPRFWAVWWAVVTFAGLAVLLLGALALGLSTWVATDDLGALGRSLLVGFGYAVPVVFLASLAAVLRTLSPRWEAAAWVAVGWIAIVGFLDDTLQLPDWARNLSPLHLVGKLPQEDPNVAAIVCLAIAAAILLALSLFGFSRRDLKAH